MKSATKIPKVVFLLLISVVVLLTLATVYLLLISSKAKENSTPNSNKSGIEQMKTTKGKRIYASGNCLTDSDCKPTGCSDQICANHEIVTTCEYVEIPEKDTYSCGCIDNYCVWYR